MINKIQRVGALLLMLFISTWLWSAELAAVPPLTTPVMDHAQMMHDQAREQLNAHLLQYSKEKGSQIVVLTVPTIKPETPFDYATRVMQKWQLGRKDIGDGVLLLLVRDDRKTHLAVGRGLEGAIPDVYAKRILDDVLRPYLQQGQTDEGIYVAVNQIEKLIAGESLPEVSQSSRSEMSIGDYLIYLILLTFLFGSFLKIIFGRILGSIFTGSAIFLLSLLFGLGLLFGLLMAIVVTILSFILASGAFISGGGGFGGGGFGGGGFGGGGFGGGGGSFGGGGASGDW